MAHSLVGPRIRERRQARRISQSALARDVGISASYLNLIEHNKRGIAGRVLNAIAKELEVDPAQLTEGDDAGMIDQLIEAASAAPGAGAELDRVTELIGRFPGWGRVIGALARQTETQERQLTHLSDRLTHDPYLAEAMHLMLTSITAVHSTAGILDENPDMAEEQRVRFTRNLYGESVRLSDTAKDLVAYFDNPKSSSVGAEQAADQLHEFWASRNFHAPELENGAEADGALLLSVPERARGEAEKSLARYALMAASLPLAPFMTEAAQQRWDPLALAQTADAPFRDLFFRLAHLPPDGDAPSFGLIECDAAGGVLFRKELPGFPLPRVAGACPLWPLYRALAQPGQPVRAVLRTPSGETFVAWAAADAEAPTDYGLPPACRSAMLFTADAGLAPPSGAAPVIEIGAQCRVCPRQTCASRRAAFLLQ